MATPQNPKSLLKWLIIAGVVYVLFPYDLLPDMLGLPGRIDDVLMLGWLGWLYRSKLREFIAAATQAESLGGSTHAGADSEAYGPAGSSSRFDAYGVLGIPRSASKETIRSAYRSQMQAYHPDKVAHLGEDLQRLALEKSQEIQRAYEQLRPQ